MSERNPNYREILEHSKGLEEMRKHFCKSYMNMASVQFMKKHNRKPTLLDAQEIYDIYEAEWREWYIDKPAREKAKRAIAGPIWHYGIKYRIDVYNALCRFLEHKYSKIITTQWGNSYPEKNAAVIMKEMDIEHTEVHIVQNQLQSEWEQFIDENYSTLKKYHKTGYTDWSHLAYSGVTDDF